jgi:RNA polymerase sigma factor (sigma-70 family)
MPGTPLNRVLHFLRPAASAGEVTDGELLRRFVATREGAAFTALVHRHGPMVLGVCRRVLDAHDAEDAFQATFLVLARRAASVRKGASVASWLYGVAWRVARKARAGAARRVVPPEPVGAAPPDPAAEAAWRELRVLLDEELSRLPEKYRAPLVLCYLEGKTNEEAARLLGWTKGTVSGRLARARDLLRARLARRGLGLTAGALAGLAVANGAPPVSAALAESTINAVLTGGATAPAAALAQGVLKAMFVTRLTYLACVGLGLALAGAAALGQGALVPRPGGPAAEAPAEPKRPSALFADPIPPAPRGDDLEGVWVGVSLERGGEKAPEAAAKKFKVVVKGNTITFNPDTEKRRATFTLGPSKKPKAIYLTPQDGPQKGEVLAGIYALEEGRLKICVDNGEGKERPKGFATRPGSTLTLLVLAREKAAVAVPPVKNQVGRLAWRHDGRSAIRAVTFSPSGGQVAAVEADGGLRLLDARTGKLTFNHQVEGESVLAAAFSPDGKMLAVGYANPTDRRGFGGTRVLDVESGKEVRMLFGHALPVSAVAYSPDGRLLATGSHDSTVKVREAQTGKEMVKVRALRKGVEVTGLTFSPDGKLLLVGSSDGLVRLFNVINAGNVRNFAGTKGRVSFLAFAPDGRRIVAAGADGVVRVWDATTGAQLRQIGARKGGTGAFALRRDGRVLAEGGAGVVRLWEVLTGLEYMALGGQAKDVTAVALSPNGRTVVSGGSDGSVSAWKLFE